MADIEVYIYGNSKDVHDNFNEVDVNKLGIEDTRHTYIGMKNRIATLQDSARYNENSLTEMRSSLWLYCQQFAYASTMVKACESIMTCRDSRLEYRFS